MPENDRASPLWLLALLLLLLLLNVEMDARREEAGAAQHGGEFGPAAFARHVRREEAEEARLQGRRAKQELERNVGRGGRRCN